MATNREQDEVAAVIEEAGADALAVIRHQDKATEDPGSIVPAGTEGKWLFLVAGPNGAGKSTLHENIRFRKALRASGLPDVVNPDETARRLRPLHPTASPKEMLIRVLCDIERAAVDTLSAGKPFAVETVLSTQKYFQLADFAREKNLAVFVLYVGAPDLDLLNERLDHRVQNLGHDVPRDRLARRKQSSEANYLELAKTAEVTLLVSNGKDGHRLEAYSERGVFTIRHEDALPTLVSQIREQFRVVDREDPEWVESAEQAL